MVDLKEAWKGIWKEFESTRPSPVNSNVKSAIDCSGERFGIKRDVSLGS